MYHPNNVEKTLKKYTKPQLLAMEKIIKEAIFCVLIACPIFMLANFADYLSGDIESLLQLFGISLMYSFFFVFIPYGAIKGNIVGYKIYRRQILEEEPPKNLKKNTDEL
jgi:hypothetical protein